MAEGDHVGIGGWVSTKHGLAWFAETYTMDEIRAIWPFLTKDRAPPAVRKSDMYDFVLRAQASATPRASGNLRASRKALGTLAHHSVPPARSISYIDDIGISEMAY
ncbi:hypothetical protein AK812_SmicGene46745 [Symbiodinium microadriaticum]|uniref:Uncharacterized protein n=1 Tax=Symbiodinium microadriaticum TaxID=2951 RepID=A0A1Q9BT58_SYMMI|nr:hypothetical protein AK812_SmicGene46745 [Symbiodinium microadriaticum]